jgi:hypothetical protein
LQRLTLKVLHVWCCYGSRDKRIGGLDWHHGFGQHEPQPCHFATVTNIHPGRLCNMFPSGKGPHYQRTEQVIDEGGCETIWLDSTNVCGSPWVVAFGVARSGVRFDPEVRPTIGRSGYHSRWLGIRRIELMVFLAWVVAVNACSCHNCIANITQVVLGSPCRYLMVVDSEVRFHVHLRKMGWA